MITRLPSYQNPRDEYWSGDPAFVKRPTHPGEKAKREEIEAYERAVEAWVRAWQVARETGDYGNVLIPGQTPTKFVVKPLAGDIRRKLNDLSMARTIGLLEVFQIAFRATVVEVVGFVEKVKQVESDFGPIADVDLANHLDAVAPGCVDELGALAINRANSLSGK